MNISINERLSKAVSYSTSDRMKAVFLLLGSALNLVASPMATALSDAYREKFEQNDIVFYDPEGGECPTSGSGSSSAANGTGGNSDGSDVYMIGDSITWLSQSKIKEVLPNITINAQSSIYFSHNETGLISGVDRVAEMGDQSILVFALGSNGGINYLYNDDTDKLFTALSGKEVKIILMTIYYSGGIASDQVSQSNNVVKQLADQYDNVSYMDWNAVASSSSDYIYNQSDDHVHPTNPVGMEKFAETVKNAINSVSNMNTSANNGSDVSGGGTGDYSAILSAYLIR